MNKFILGLGLLAVCFGQEGYEYEAFDQIDFPIRAVCRMQGYDPAIPSAGGYVTFEQAAPTGPTTINFHIEGLTAGQEHAFHIHEKGDLTKGCASTLGHYNPSGDTHGGIHHEHRHAGDLGNVQADSTGLGEMRVVDNQIKLYGKESIVGRSCVVHLHKDDEGEGGHEDSHLNGHAGPRIGCGVVGLM